MNTILDEPNPAALGDLAPARNCMNRGDLQAAWVECLEAIRIRPFHPEAVLLAGKIALAAHDFNTARLCVDRALRTAPGLAESHIIVLPAVADQESFEWPGREELINSGPLRISVCMIVKDEEAFLGKCLESVRQIASQIVVVDTGSTDRTVEIAREHGAEIHLHVWNDDFSAARNAAMVHAKGDWILALDADEELTPGAGQRLVEEINNPAVIAYEVPLVNEGREEEGAVCLPRLFRNIPGAFYEGRIHEQIVAGLIRRTLGWGLETRVSQAVLLHHGYSREVSASRNKPQRNLRLLQKEIENPPADPVARAYLFSHFGLETARTGDLAGGILYYERALELLNQLVDSNKGGISISPEFRASFLQQFAPYLNRAGRHLDVIRLYQTPLARSGEMSASDHYTLGLARGRTGQYEQAAREFQACLAKRRASTRVPNHAIVLGDAPFQCLASALMQLKRHGETEMVYRQGISEQPQSVELRLEYARFKLQQGRPLEALRDTHLLTEKHSDNTAVWLLGAEICLAHPQFREIVMDWTAAAVERHPGDPEISAMRAEALLVAGDAQAAQALLQPMRDLPTGLAGRSLAAFIFCRMFEDAPTLPAVDAQTEPRVSQAFLDLYRRIGLAGGTAIVQLVKSRIHNLEATLPLAFKAITQI